MKLVGWLHCGSMGLLVALGFLGSFGCSNDESAGPPINETPVGWSRLFTGQASDPAFAPPGPRAGLLAFASFRSTTRPDSLAAHEHIWVLDPSDSTFMQITVGETDDYDPNWSADGNRLVFTRDNGARRDIFWVDVHDLAAPAVPVRVTDRAQALTGATSGCWLVLGGQEVIAYADGKDIWWVSPAGGSATKLVPDPGDRWPSGCGGVHFEDLEVDPAPAGGRLAVISRGRTPLGAIHIVADSAGVPIPAELWIQPCDSIAVSATEATFTDLPVGTYQVRAFRQGTGLCDTLQAPAVIAQTSGIADTASVGFSFSPAYGELLLRSVSRNPSEFTYYLDCQPTSSSATPVNPDVPRDSLIFTPLECVPAGLHMLAGTQGIRLDTAWVNVQAGQVQRVTLQFLSRGAVDSLPAGNTLKLFEPRGTEGTFFTRRCVRDSICVREDSTGLCLEYGCFDKSVCLESTLVLGDSLNDCQPPVLDTTRVCSTYVCTRYQALDWTEEWIRLADLCTTPPAGGSAGGLWFKEGTFPILMAPRLQEEELWIFDLASGAFTPPSPGTQAQKPVWDPTPGANRVAFVTRSGEHWGISVIDLTTQPGHRTDLALPGLSGAFVCQRDAIGLSWAADGKSLAVTLGPCSGGDYPRDLEIWIADLTSLGGL